MDNDGVKQIYFKVLVEHSDQTEILLIHTSPRNAWMEVGDGGALKQSNVAGWASMWLKDGRMYQKKGYFDFSDKAPTPFVPLGSGSKIITEDSFKTYRQFMDLCDKATWIGLHELKDKILEELTK